MSATGNRPAGAEQGFTLIEALVVLAVTALIAGMSFASIEKLTDFWNLRAAFLAVDSGLTRARAKALRGSDPVEFRVAPAQGRFAVTGEPVQDLQKPVAFLPGTTDVRFFPDGSATTGRVGITAGARKAWFSISPDTGLISVSQ